MAEKQQASEPNLAYEAKDAEQKFLAEKITAFAAEINESVMDVWHVFEDMAREKIATAKIDEPADKDGVKT